ncbi:MAG: 50S ribosomal protein L18 [Planctomycetaceae bacterium]|nr:50S ribosomal protein L18 [Planctomycetaceae bacterium]
MNAQKTNEARAFRRKMHVRNRIRASRAYKPRLSVFKTSRHVYAQLIDDRTQKTLAAASTMSAELKGKFKHGGNIEAAKLVGELIGKKIADAGIKEIAFDRGPFKYHGCIKALADGARSAGLKF